MDAQLEQQDASVSSEECVEGMQSQYKCIGIQALPDVCHAQTQVAIVPEVTHSGKECNGVYTIA